MRVAIQTTAVANRNTTTAVNDRNLPISTEAMVDTAKERGRLQKIRSMSERCRKLWRLVNQAAM